MTFSTIFRKSLFAFGISAATACGALACGDGQGGCDAQAAENPHSQVVIEAFLNACHSAPDPASLSYYLDQLDNNTHSARDVKASIATTCNAKNSVLCQHVSGLDEPCKTATN